MILYRVYRIYRILFFECKHTPYGGIWYSATIKKFLNEQLFTTAHHLLWLRYLTPAKITPGITIVHIVFILEHAIFFSIVFEHKLLVADDHAFIIPAILKGEPAVKGSYLLFGLIFPVHSHSPSMNRDTIPL